MKKIFTFLTGILVCALMTNSAMAASKTTNAAPLSGGSPGAVFPAAAAIKSFLSVSETINEIAAAKNLLKAQLPTGGAALAKVTLAVLDPVSSQINFFSVPKDSFLVRGADLAATTQLGRSVRLHVIRANGVNTAVTVADTVTGHQFLPLVVQFPIVKGGSLVETAYYTSAHPELLTSDVAAAGNDYVTTMMEMAARHLADTGVNVAPDLVNVAEHLVIVEHTDHQRFINDDRSQIYPEILSLYALNQGDTYRYSVSSAGAGGMIQMIPRTYAGIRQLHPAIDLKTDFVDGMQNHANALEAMLLYINDTWNYLQKREEVRDALRNGTANKAQLIAAGYNSNPMRLPTYLKNGGAGWRSLIPAETQLYLTIYDSVDSNVQFKSAPLQDSAARERSTGPSNNSDRRPSTAALLVAWISERLEQSGRAILNVALPKASSGSD